VGRRAESSKSSVQRNREIYSKARRKGKRVLLLDLQEGRLPTHPWVDEKEGVRLSFLAMGNGKKGKKKGEKGDYPLLSSGGSRVFRAPDHEEDGRYH